MNRGIFSLSAVMLTLLTTVFIACGSAGPGTLTPEEVRSMKAQVDEMDQRVSENREQLEALQQTTDSQSNKIARLSDNTAEMEDRLTLVESRMDFVDSIKAQMQGRLSSLESAGSYQGRTSPQKDAGGTVTMSDAEYQSQYQQAYSVYQEENYEDAIPMFAKVIEARPTGDLSDNAQYWIGECYYGLKNYTRAIVEFEKVFTFKDSNKDDDAQLKLGLCYLNIGQDDKARDEFQRLVDFYPDSEYKSTAVKYLNQL